MVLLASDLKRLLCFGSCGESVKKLQFNQKIEENLVGKLQTRLQYKKSFVSKFYVQAHPLNAQTFVFWGLANVHVQAPGLLNAMGKVVYTLVPSKQESRKLSRS
eukprot:TRINITY_DN23594_c0_g1_i2.p2 TRINITY_DN23594_c0_g1~~TRINITY_DN23594_c0_g1_i2.p2  ORF type:complete len:104 (-),score=9.97 TRINITY_DN23594_c0_g1_i2:134-445(-)